MYFDVNSMWMWLNWDINWMLIHKMLFKPSFLLLLVANLLTIKFTCGNTGKKFIINFKLIRKERLPRMFV